MRTTVTVDPDVEAKLRRLMREHGLSFKEALNQALRAGLHGTTNRPAKRFQVRTFRMGRPQLNFDKALALAFALEDDETVRKLALNK